MALDGGSSSSVTSSPQCTHSPQCDTRESHVETVHVAALVSGLSSSVIGSPECSAVHTHVCHTFNQRLCSIQNLRVRVSWLVDWLTG